MTPRNFGFLAVLFSALFVSTAWAADEVTAVTESPTLPEAAAGPVLAAPQEFTPIILDNVQLHLDPSHKPFKDKGIITMTVEHLGIYEHGTLFSFIDVESSNDFNPTPDFFYGEIAPVINVVNAGPVIVGVSPLQLEYGASTAFPAGPAFFSYLSGVSLTITSFSSVFNALVVQALVKKPRI